LVVESGRCSIAGHRSKDAGRSAVCLSALESARAGDASIGRTVGRAFHTRRSSSGDGGIAERIILNDCRRPERKLGGNGAVARRCQSALGSPAITGCKSAVRHTRLQRNTSAAR
jgi:hypothetical protein